MRNRFTQKAQGVLNYAIRFANELGHTYIGSEHLLLGLLAEESGIAAHILKQRGVGIDAVKSAVVQLAGVGTPSSLSATDMTPRTKNIIEASLYESQRNGQDYIGTEHLLAALLGERDCVGVRILESIGISISDLKNDVTAFLTDTPGADRDISNSSPHNGTKRDASASALSSAPTLKSHGRDLTALAREGKIDPIIGSVSKLPTFWVGMDNAP